MVSWVYIVGGLLIAITQAFVAYLHWKQTKLQSDVNQLRTEARIRLDPNDVQHLIDSNVQSSIHNQVIPFIQGYIQMSQASPTQKSTSEPAQPSAECRDGVCPLKVSDQETPQQNIHQAAAHALQSMLETTAGMQIPIAFMEFSQQQNPAGVSVEEIK